MKFNGDIYFEAAQEHYQAAIELHNVGRYVLSHYVAGLAVECMFRAYRYCIDPSPENFDEKHDLYNLFAASKFDTVTPEKSRAQVGAALQTLRLRWNNDFRFCSEIALLPRLK